MKLIWLTVEVGGDMGSYKVGINPAQIISVSERMQGGRSVGSEVWVNSGYSPVPYAVAELTGEVARLFEEATA